MNIAELPPSAFKETTNNKFRLLEIGRAVGLSSTVTAISKTVSIKWAEEFLTESAFGAYQHRQPLPLIVWIFETYTRMKRYCCHCFLELLGLKVPILFGHTNSNLRPFFLPETLPSGRVSAVTNALFENQSYLHEPSLKKTPPPGRMI